MLARNGKFGLELENLIGKSMTSNTYGEYSLNVRDLDHDDKEEIINLMIDLEYQGEINEELIYEIMDENNFKVINKQFTKVIAHNDTLNRKEFAMKLASFFMDNSEPVIKRYADYYETILQEYIDGHINHVVYDRNIAMGLSPREHRDNGELYWV